MKLAIKNIMRKGYHAARVIENYVAGNCWLFSRCSICERKSTPLTRMWVLSLLNKSWFQWFQVAHSQLHVYVHIVPHCTVFWVIVSD